MNREPFESFGMLRNRAARGTLRTGRYSVDIADDPDSPFLGRYIITSTGTAESGDTCILQQRAHIQTYANYMHASHFESRGGSPVYFGPSDVIDGQVYCNDRINIYGSARLLQMTRSAALDVNYRSGGTSASFEGGLELGVPPLDFSGIYSQDHVDRIQDQAAGGGLVISGNCRLTFQSDGDVVVRQGANNTTYDLSTFNGAIYVDGNATVQGVLDGSVTVASEGAISIPDGGVQYESASGSNPSPYDNTFNPDDVNDTLGLIARDAVLLTGRATTPIHAAILVTGEGDGFGSTRRYDYLGNPEIQLYGSLSQYRRGIVGTTGGRGFVKKYKYDSRLLITPPPHYPFSTYTYSVWRRVE